MLITNMLCTNLNIAKRKSEGCRGLKAKRGEDEKQITTVLIVMVALWKWRGFLEKNELHVS